MSKKHEKYRIWYDNWNAQIVPIPRPKVAEEIDVVMRLTSKAVLVTRGDLSHGETLKEIDNLRKLCEQSPFDQYNKRTP